MTKYWLRVLIMSRMHFRVTPHSIDTWMSRNSLLETGAIHKTPSNINFLWPVSWIYSILKIFMEFSLIHYKIDAIFRFLRFMYHQVCDLCEPCTSYLGLSNSSCKTCLHFYCLFSGDKRNSIWQLPLPVLLCLDYWVLLICLVKVQNLRKTCSVCC